MSRTFSAPRWGFSAALAGVLALALTALAALGLAAQADAAFTTGKCAGPDIVGRGASFARDAHKVFNFNFKNNYCNGTPGFGVLNVAYEALGSGAGRLSMKVREDTPRFGQSDEPPIASEVAQMNAGTGNEPAETDTDPSDNGKIHVIPAAVGSVAALVNFPDGCDVGDLPEVSRTPEQNLDEDGTPDDVMRVRFNKAQFEAAWAQNEDAVPGGTAPYVSWRDVFPTLEDNAGCNKPIVRVVRFDESGTTFAFKDYLNSLNGARGWKTTYAFGANQTKEWPGAEYGTRTDCSGEPNGPGAKPDSEDHLTSGCSNGNGSLVSKLISTDGSIGYSDVSTARNASPSLAIEPEANDNDTYWTQVQNGADAFVEPTADANGFRTDGFKGANCQATEFDGVPSDTFGDWSKASGVNSEVGYGICTMTYGLVFDDNADVWGNSPAEEAKARTVKDYWENVVSEAGQGQLFGNDYAPLPPAVLAISKAGVDQIGWNKGEDSSGGGDTGGGGGGGDTGGGSSDSSATPAPAPLKPSNLFSLPRKSISSKTGGATISVKLPGAGKLVMVGTAKVKIAQKRKSKRRHRKSKTIKVGQVVLNASKAGTYNLSLKPSGAAKKELRKKGKLRVSLALTFTPTGGEAKTTTTGVTLKLKKNGKRKGKRHHKHGGRG